MRQHHARNPLCHYLAVCIVTASILAISTSNVMAAPTASAPLVIEQTSRRLALLHRRVQACVSGQIPPDQVFPVVDLVVRDALRNGVPPRTLNDLLLLLSGDQPVETPVVVEGLACRKLPVLPNLAFEVHGIGMDAKGMATSIATYSLPVADVPTQTSVFVRTEGQWQLTDSADDQWWQSRVWTFPGCPSFAFVRHLQAADRTEGRLSICRIEHGKIKTEREHPEAMLDYTVERDEDGSLGIDYGKIPENSFGAITEARSRHRVVLRQGPLGIVMSHEQLTPWLDLVDQCLVLPDRRTGREPEGVRDGMALLDAVPDRHQVFFTGEEGSLNTGIGSITLRVWGARVERDVRALCGRTADGHWHVTGVREPGE